MHLALARPVKSGSLLPKLPLVDSEGYYTWQSIWYTALLQAPPDIPLSLGDLVGISFRTFRERLRTFVSMLFWPTMLATFSVAGIRWCSLHFLNARTLELSPVLLHGGAIFVCFALLTFAQWELALRSIAVTRAALGADLDVKTSLVYAKRRKWAAMLLYNAAVFVPVVMMLLWAGVTVAYVFLYGHGKGMQPISFIFFSLVGLSATVTICWSLLISAMAFTILSFEDVKLGEIYSRTFKLTHAYLWRGGSYMILLSVTLFAVATAVNLPLLAVSLVDAIQSHSLTATNYEEPMYLQIMSAVSDSFINIILLGVAPIGMGFYYHDLCLRSEGRDIVSRIAKLKTPSVL